MKALTQGRLAASGIRSNKRAYFSLAGSIFLAIFLGVSVLLGLDCIYQGGVLSRNQKYGQEDGFLLGAAAQDSQVLTGNSLVEDLGTVTLMGSLDGTPVGCYDKTAQMLLQRSLFSGRMPQAAGEVTLDLDILEGLQPNAQLGDELSLAITDLNGTLHHVAYRLVGILMPDSKLDSKEMASFLPENCLGFPGVYLYPGDKLLADTPVQKHLVFTLPRETALTELEKALPSARIIGSNYWGELLLPVYYRRYSGAQILMMQEYTFPLLSIGLCLMACAMIGIWSATNSQLVRKSQQYRLLRSVGATRGQILTISCRESLLLSVVTAPAATLASTLFLWTLSRLFSSDMRFTWNWLLTLAALTLSFFLVQLATFLPALLSLGRPLLDTDSPIPGKYLRPIPSRKHSSLASLMNRRNLRFHPFRQLCAVALLVILNLTVFFSTVTVQNYFSDQYGKQNTAFTIHRTDWSPSIRTLCTLLPEKTLSSQDIDELLALPQVSQAQVTWKSDVILLTRHVGTYLPLLRSSNYHLWALHPELKEIPNAFPDSFTAMQTQDTTEHTWLENALGTDKTSIQLQLFVVSDLDMLASYLQEGQIREEEINAGREVLVQAPDWWASFSENGYERTTSKNPANILQYDTFIQNDQFVPGDTLELVQMCLDPQALPQGVVGGNLYSYAQRRDASVKIGGILSSDYASDVCIITTPQGLENMGLECSPIFNIDIRLSETPDLQTEQVLADQLRRIASRGDLELYNHLESRRSTASHRLRNALTLTSVCIVFLLLTVNLITGNQLHYLRADKKAIATLRAVGCDAATLQSIHSRQIFTSMLLAGGITLVIAAAIGILEYYPWHALVCSLSGMTLVWLLCHCQISRFLRKLTQQPVIDHIREL